MSDARESCLYEGTVRHRRFAPVPHEFSYRMFMVYLDLAELGDAFRGRWLWSVERPAPARFKRSDHWGDPSLPLDEAIRRLVAERAGERPAGPIRLLTHLRYWGHCFNPVSFYYCFDRSGRRLETVVGEVSNTPWGEMHPYVLPESMNQGDETRKRYRFPKAFHVSPFMDMDQSYDWRFTVPERQLVVHMENLERGERIFDATMTMERREMTGGALASALARHPFMTAKVVAAIYAQAGRLWLKKAPFYSHPKSREKTGA
ncbi:MAG TPA: DUF1365 domain-containing protein [Elusimicrobiota bacterium]|nr:DUF1365 domain-containing protein [Elusimicrobiota bacterium]